MMMMMMKISKASLLLLAFPLVASAAKEAMDSFVEFPEELQPRLAAEQKMFISQGHKRKVRVHAFQMFPEPDVSGSLPSQRIWPVLQPLITRMEGVFYPRPLYYLQTGEEYECRKEGQFVNNDHCQRHCTHQGRYCSPKVELPEGKHGRDVVQEVIRRLCLDESHELNGNDCPVTDGRFYKYLQEFEQRNCFSETDTAKCSLEAMNQVGIPTDKGLERCLRDPSTYELDQPHDVLEQSLQYFHKFSYNYTSRDMPQIDINGNGIMPKDWGKEIRVWSPEFILDHYCRAFPMDINKPYQGKPLVCEICGDCQDVQTCLTTLACDGRDFEAAKYHNPSQDYNAIQFVQHFDDTPAPSAPPTVAPVAVETGTSYETEMKQQASFTLLVVVVILLVVGLVGCFVYRQNQATRRKNILLQSSIPTEGDNNVEPYSDMSNLPSPYSDEVDVDGAPAVGSLEVDGAPTQEYLEGELNNENKIINNVMC